MIDLVNLGLAYFIENLSEPEKYELGKAIDQSEESYLLNIWRVKNNVTDDWNGSKPFSLKKVARIKRVKNTNLPIRCKSWVLSIYQWRCAKRISRFKSRKSCRLARLFRNKRLFLLILVSMHQLKTLLFILLRRVQSLVYKMW